MFVNIAEENCEQTIYFVLKQQTTGAIEYCGMNDKNYELAEALVPKTYLQLAAQARHQRENLLTNLLAQV